MSALENPGDGEILDLLPLPLSHFFVLFALAEGEKHGYRIMQDVKLLSNGTLRMGPASLYTTIQRLSDEGFIEEISTRDGDRRRTYRLTGNGKRLLDAEFSRQHDVLALAKRKRVFSAGGRV
ncbi:MAG TPA: PadR family transcriptional regulator [Acidobacteriaceae bacterium]|jgi:DNA-binding PadR family transcriptional regulator|nr:PadR family transcriptional regulator [Acidobacteriaceae bacterium]